MTLNDPTSTHSNPVIVPDASLLGEVAHCSDLDMRNLLESLNPDPVADKELYGMLHCMRQGQSIDKDACQKLVTASMLHQTHHLNELMNTMGDFQIDLR
ncbi:uncharacterized protein BYT42DRAFT_589680 [Radiomyces spectabilis]|uniref:uncharacterized protein n=1 Tax=Radiomyces spectabilis TaxID=64574 RepID=UPI00221EB1F2|nr:uncharacterized protein BYT42DRAFT_589680 [Radiomyces spectabilis]KAI8365371.1 hypothetical protein BYT42DRAFT_589680 [Radiomyces spectabilis]